MIPLLQRRFSIKDEEIDPSFDLTRSFDDSGFRDLKQKISVSSVNKDGMNSSPIDVFRQGSEITQTKYRFMSAAPKLWAGNIKHWIEPNRIGQDVDFTHFDEDIDYKEKQSTKWNPVAHLYDTGNNFLLFNDGQQQQFRSSIDPFYIYGKKPSIEDAKDPITGPKRVVTETIQQLVRQNSNNISLLENSRPRFDEQGSGQLEVMPLASFKPIAKKGWSDATTPLDIPFHDEISTSESSNPLIKQLTNPPNDIISALIKNSNLDLDEMLEGDFELRSATAGFVYSDRNSSRNGTDSIAFGGLVRGW